MTRGSKEPKADPLDSVDLMKSLNQCQKVDSLILEIDAVGGQVDSGENDLLVTFLCQDLYFLLHILRPAASDAASRIRNDAVAAELVAAVLNLDEGAGCAPPVC